MLCHGSYDGFEGFFAKDGAATEGFQGGTVFAFTSRPGKEAGPFRRVLGEVSAGEGSGLGRRIDPSASSYTQDEAEHHDRG